MAQPQQYNPQIPPPCFPQYLLANSPSTDSNESLLARVFNRQMDMVERQEKHDMEREEKKLKKKQEKMREEGSQPKSMHQQCF